MSQQRETAVGTTMTFYLYSRHEYNFISNKPPEVNEHGRLKCADKGIEMDLCEEGLALFGVHPSDLAPKGDEKAGPVIRLSFSEPTLEVGEYQINTTWKPPVLRSERLAAMRKAKGKKAGRPGMTR